MRSGKPMHVVWRGRGAIIIIPSLEFASSGTFLLWASESRNYPTIMHYYHTLPQRKSILELHPLKKPH